MGFGQWYSRKFLLESGDMMMMSFICSCRNKIGAKLLIYLEEGTYHKRLFRGPSTNDMKTVPDTTTANSTGAPPRSQAPVSTENQSGVGGSSVGQDKQSQIVLPQETGEQPSLLSSLNDTS